jgi:hypothetical protein
MLNGLMNNIATIRECFQGHILVQLLGDLRPDPQEDQRRRQAVISVHSKAVRTVNENLRLKDKATSDTTILAVLALSYADMSGKGVISTVETIPGITQGPLKMLRRLDIGPPPKNVVVHFDGLCQMIELRGGIHEVSLPGLAQLICATETSLASRSLRQPRCDILTFLKFDLKTSLEINRRPDHPLQRMGIAFNAIKKGDASPSRTAVAECLEQLALYSLGVDDHIAARFIQQSLDVIADQRTYVQHCLMMLMRVHVDASVDLLTKLCHLIGVLYSFLCVWPISDAPFSELLQMIKRVLLQKELRSEWTKSPELMVWALFMSGIISIGSPERVMIVAMLERCLRKLSIDTWEDLREILLQHLWLPITNDADGIMLWSEIEASNPFEWG